MRTLHDAFAAYIKDGGVVPDPKTFAPPHRITVAVLQCGSDTSDRAWPQAFSDGFSIFRFNMPVSVVSAESSQLAQLDQLG
jgi:hypothetical protein